jgi:hypothetical protein
MADFSYFSSINRIDPQKSWLRFSAEWNQGIRPTDILEICPDIKLSLRRIGTNSDVDIIADASSLAFRLNGSSSERFMSFGLCRIGKSQLPFCSSQLSLGLNGIGTPLLTFIKFDSQRISFERFDDLLLFLKKNSLEIPALSLISHYGSVEYSLRRVQECLQKADCSPFEMTAHDITSLLLNKSACMELQMIEEGIELARYLWLREEILRS